MAEDDLRIGSNLEKFIRKLLGIKPSQVNPFTVKDLFEEEKILDYSTQAGLVDEPVGKLREKTTGTKINKTGKTYLGVANTKEAAKIAKKYGFKPGDFITPEDIAKYPELEKAIQGSRPYIEAGLPAGSFLPDPFPGEEFNDYYERVKKTYLPKAQNVIALQNQVAKNYKEKYRPYSDVTKTVEYQQSGALNFDPDAEKSTGLKIPDKENLGIRAEVTKALEKNEGYITKDFNKSIDKAIADYVDKVKQEDFDKFSVDLMGEVDPDTKKPYTPYKIKKMLSDRATFISAKYWNKKLTKEIVDEVMTDLMGRQGNYNVGKLAEESVNKIAPKKIAKFTTALMGIIGSGKASTLLSLGTKAAIPGIGIPLEIATIPDLESSTFYPEDEQAAADKERLGIEQIYLNFKDKISPNDYYNKLVEIAKNNFSDPLDAANYVKQNFTGAMSLYNKK